MFGHWRETKLRVNRSDRKGSDTTRPPVPLCRLRTSTKVQNCQVARAYTLCVHKNYTNRSPARRVLLRADVTICPRRNGSLSRCTCACASMCGTVISENALSFSVASLINKKKEKRRGARFLCVCAGTERWLSRLPAPAGRDV